MVSFLCPFAKACHSFLIFLQISFHILYFIIGLGSDLALFVSSPGTITNISYNSVTKAQQILQRYMMALTAYILISCAFCEKQNAGESETDSKFWVASTPRDQLVASILFSLGGAYAGNFSANAIARMLNYPSIPLGTLTCNAIFALLSLSLNIMRLSDDTWGESLVLRAFSINFCGAASLFAKHASDNRELYAKRPKGLHRMGINVVANLVFATMVFWIALEIEELLNQV